MKEIKYKTSRTCSREIDVTLDDNNIITSCHFVGGCSGNTQGVSKLVIGMTAEEAIKRLKGIDCNGKGTSCPDQLSKALEQNLGK